MISADDARKGTTERRVDFVQTHLKIIEELVKRAMASGEFSISYPAPRDKIPYGKDNELRKALETLGYDAKYEDGDQREPAPRTLNISWYR